MTLEYPGWLLLSLLLIPTWWWLRRGREAFTARRWILIGVARSVLIVLLAIAMAEPVFERQADGLTVAVVVDRSRSIPRRPLERAVAALEEASRGPSRQSGDQLAVVQLGRDAVPTAMPDPSSVISLQTGPADVTETNLAGGIEQAKGLLPRDTASRIVLVSDGNETIGNLDAAASLAQEAGIPIDVLPITYEYDQEALVERLIAPARARRDQSIELRVVLRSRGPMNGTLVLEQNDSIVDLNPDGPSNGLPIALEGGTHVERITVNADRIGPIRHRVTFQPAGTGRAGGDRIAANNVGAAVTFVSGAGAVLVVETVPNKADRLVEALADSGLNVVRKLPAAVEQGVVGLLAYDAIVLADVSRWSMSERQVRDLRGYVRDTGGGLLVTGGPESFGAGGWIGSELAPAIPVNMDPPAERQIVKGALVIIVHSCEMPQGNYWGRKVAEAAIESLNAADEVGLIERAMNQGGAKWVFPLRPVGNRAAALDAAGQLIFADMQFFEPSMELALNGLRDTLAGQRHVIIISDGDPEPPPAALLDRYVTAGITVSTVMVGGHGNNPLDKAAMQRVAALTGGTFYLVDNPNDLPQIFIKEARVVSRSLIQEGQFKTMTTDTLGGPLRGLEDLPSVRGYVLTEAREGLARVGATVENGTNRDPLVAWWNYGLGRTLAYTSDLSGRWASAWLAWPFFNAFWEQSTRWLMRSSTPSDYTLKTRDEGGGEFVVELEALDPSSEFLNFLETKATVIDPNGEAYPLTLQQTGPGRYRGEFRQRQAGTSVINAHFAGRDSQGEIISANIQAAVARAYSDEFRTLVDNASQLAKISEQTGGRVLSIDSEVPMDLFDREGVVMPATSRPVWNILAVLAAILLILDIGLRRLAVDPDRVRAVLASRGTRRDPNPAGSLSAWRRTRAAAQRRRPVVAEERPDHASGPTAVTEDDGVSESTSDPPEEVEDGDDLDTTSRLKAARRRARGEDR